MKYKTEIIKVEEVEFDINPVRVLQSLLDKLLQQTRRDLFSVNTCPITNLHCIIKDNLEVYKVLVEAGYNHGHYQSDGYHREEIITKELDSATYAKLVSFKKTLMYLEEEQTL